ncbi:replication factor C subunit 3-like [Euphorbia lathyris]|uniref:replication factor C subunit 3-like n=1 Tax=Euphorbia lathyris TaxID=212925 RepID=UPI0033135AA4
MAARQAIIQRSTSDPFLSSSSSSKTRILSSTRSTSTSSRSNKSVYWLQWSNVTKLGSLISLGRKSSDSGSRNSDLTEESLEAHNRRQEEIIFQSHRISVDDRNAKCSPYYKGLTDYSLIINRGKNQSAASPGHESHATATTSTSISSFVLVKMQEWSSCFSSSASSVMIKPYKDKENNVPAVSVDVTLQAPEIQTERKGPDKCVLSVINEEKPLRERVSASEFNLPLKETLVSKVFDGRRFRWGDKYRPKALKDFICNRSTAAKMQTLTMMKGVECHHFIFEGPAGVGKRTMIWAMLQEAYGPECLQTREESKAFNLKGESVGTIEVRIKVSSQHIEVNLSDLKGYEKHVIVELIKGTNHGKSLSKPDPCRAIILYNADKLSADAVLYIKWLLERYKGSSKFFFCCSDVSKLQPIKELCTFVQLFLPSKEEILEVLDFIAKQEGIEVPRKFAERIAEHSKNNFRQAIRALEASWERSYPFTEDEEILTGWEDDIANIAMDIIHEQSPKQLYIIRGKLQNLIEHDVSPDFIFNTLKEELKKHLDGMSKVLLENLYKDYHRKDGNMLEGENQLMFSNSRHDEAGKKLHEDPARKKFYQFMNIEEFIAKFMSFYKSHITS